LEIDDFCSWDVGNCYDKNTKSGLLHPSIGGKKSQLYFLGSTRDEVQVKKAALLLLQFWSILGLEYGLLDITTNQRTGMLFNYRYLLSAQARPQCLSSEFIRTSLHNCSKFSQPIASTCKYFLKRGKKALSLNLEQFSTDTLRRVTVRPFFSYSHADIDNTA
jgi:hypothetical protein